MVSNQMLTVRIPEGDLEKLDQLAAVRGRSRSQLVQEALAELISKSENLRDLEFARLKKRLKPAIAEQCKLLDESESFADDNRTFWVWKLMDNVQDDSDLIVAAMDLLFARY